MIQLEALQVGYRERLYEVEELTLLEGDIYALIGVNGSGKSTLFKHILREAAPISGSILLNGKPIAEINRLDFSRMLAFVGTRFDGLDFLTVGDYVSLGRTPYTNLIGTLQQEDRNIVCDTMKALSIDHLLPMPTHAISDGERQMVSIARALIQQTSLLLLDEPTAFLDYGNRYRIIQILKKLANVDKKCILFSTHDIDLCFSQNIPFLLVDVHKMVLMKVPTGWSKEEIIRVGFDIH
jgi:iron complex transport system ATP-binding protein